MPNQAAIKSTPVPKAHIEELKEEKISSASITALVKPSILTLINKEDIPVREICKQGFQQSYPKGGNMITTIAERK